MTLHPLEGGQVATPAGACQPPYSPAADHRGRRWAEPRGDKGDQRGERREVKDAERDNPESPTPELVRALNTL